MTTDDVRRVLKTSFMPYKIALLSYVSLGELEFDVIYLRYFLLLTQEKAVERLPYIYSERLKIPLETAMSEYSISLTGLQKIEYRAIDKCRKAWCKLIFVQELLTTCD